MFHNFQVHQAVQAAINISPVYSRQSNRTRGQISSTYVLDQNTGRLAEFTLTWVLPRGPRYSSSFLELNSPAVKDVDLGIKKGSASWQLCGMFDPNCYVDFGISILNGPKTDIPAKVTWSVGICNGQPAHSSPPAEHIFRADCIEATSSQFLSHADFFVNRAREVMPDNILTIQVKVVLLNCPYSRAAMPSESERKQARLERIYAAHEESDFVLISSDGRRFPAHRLILKISSEVFAAMLTHDTEDKKTGECLVDDIDGETLEALLDYFYGKPINSRLMILAENLFVAADKYDLAELGEICAKHLLENIAMENVADRYILADQYEMEEMSAVAFAFIKSDLRRFVDGGGLDRIREYNQECANALFVRIGGGTFRRKRPASLAGL